MAIQVVDGIVLGSTAVGDAHLIVKIVRPVHGKMSVMARGARSPKKRFSGCFDIGTQVTLHLKKGRGSLALVHEATVTKLPLRARERLLTLAYLSYGCEVVAFLVTEQQESSKYYGLLLAWLSLLESDAGPSVASRLAFEAKALTFSGLMPHFLRCPQCGEDLQGSVHFSDANGGGVHARCGTGQIVHSSFLRQIEGLRRTPLMKTQSEVLGPGDRGLLLAFMQHHIGRGLKSHEWLKEVEQMEREDA